jgi:hypothetical protein
MRKPPWMRPIACCHNIDSFACTPLRDRWQLQLFRARARIFGMNVPIDDITHTQDKSHFDDQSPQYRFVFLLCLQKRQLDNRQYEIERRQWMNFSKMWKKREDLLEY